MIFKGNFCFSIGNSASSSTDLMTFNWEKKKFEKKTNRWEKDNKNSLILVKDVNICIWQDRVKFSVVKREVNCQVVRIPEAKPPKRWATAKEPRFWPTIAVWNHIVHPPRHKQKDWNRQKYEKDIQECGRIAGWWVFLVSFQIEEFLKPIVVFSHPNCSIQFLFHRKWNICASYFSKNGFRKIFEFHSE